jgi:hypothetical protein
MMILHRGQFLAQAIWATYTVVSHGLGLVICTTQVDDICRYTIFTRL